MLSRETVRFPRTTWSSRRILDLYHEARKRVPDEHRSHVAVLEEGVQEAIRPQRSGLISGVVAA